MKNIVKRPLKAVWRLFPAGLRPRMAAWWHEWFDPIPEPPQPEKEFPKDIELILDSMVREMTRLQLQIQDLKVSVDALRTDAPGKPAEDGPETNSNPERH